MQKDAWDFALVVLTGMGALFTGIAAIATAFAARAAYKATATALQIANRDALERRQIRLESQKIIAGAYLNPLYLLAYQAEAWRILSNESDCNVGNVIRRLSFFDVAALDALMTRIELFKAKDAIVIGQAYTSAKSLIHQAQKLQGDVDGWSVEMKANQKAFLHDELTRLADVALHGWIAFCNLSGEPPDENNPVEAGKIYAQRELENIRRDANSSRQRG
jgi:hypothetical protein